MRGPMNVKCSMYVTWYSMEAIRMMGEFS